MFIEIDEKISLVRKSVERRNKTVGHQLRNSERFSASLMDWWRAWRDEKIKIRVYGRDEGRKRIQGSEETGFGTAGSHTYGLTRRREREERSHMLWSLVGGTSTCDKHKLCWSHWPQSVFVLSARRTRTLNLDNKYGFGIFTK